LAAGSDSLESSMVEAAKGEAGIKGKAAAIDGFKLVAKGAFMLPVKDVFTLVAAINDALTSAANGAFTLAAINAVFSAAVGAGGGVVTWHCGMGEVGS